MEEDDNFIILPPPVEPFKANFDRILAKIGNFTEFCGPLKLRRYQIEVAECIVKSVIKEKGLSIVVMFPRQSGKNEVQAQIEGYLLGALCKIDTEIVKISPTYKPQTLNAMRRLQRVLENNLAVQGEWEKESGYIFRIGKARMIFLSGSPEANIVGATASALLEVDEAQDISLEKFDREIAPMAASTNATRVFWGTAWTSRTLLGRELRLSRQAEKAGGEKRTFVLTADEVSAEVPAYGRHVAEQIARLGRNSPMVRTQYFSEEIDAEGGMFPAWRVALMRGCHTPQSSPAPGAIYCLLVDVAGEDAKEETQNIASLRDPGQGQRYEKNFDQNNEAGNSASLRNPSRDSTALTVVQVDLGGLADPLLHAPRYLAVFRRSWVGVQHTRLYAEIKALAETWRCRWLAVDATGVGAGLASFLSAALPGRVLPFVFSSKSKSELGWDFLEIVDAGRWKEFVPLQDRGGAEQAALQEQFYRQLSFCLFEITPGPEKRMKWGTENGARDPANGEFVHDDLVLSAALCAALDRQPWSAGRPAAVIQAADPLKSMDREF